MAKDAMDEPIPINDSLEALYPPSALASQGLRWNALREKFASAYGHGATFVSRSPGRVNIIGEHIDYSLYDCLPMGIAADVLIAASFAPAPASGPASCSLLNADGDRFPARTFSLEADGSVQIDASSHEWTNYFRAGLKGALAHLRRTTHPGLRPVSMKMVVDGSVPAGGGLSSSAAFVCASALAVLYANGCERVTKRALVEMAVVSERAVGVNSGGMDQAASACSVRGDALHVGFWPELRARAVAFPKLLADEPVVFMVAQSFVAADKHVTAPVCYNLRVVEVTLAAEWIAARLRLELKEDASSLGKSLRGLQEAYFAEGGEVTEGMSEPDKLRRMLALVEEHIPDEAGYTREQIAETLRVSVPELEKRYMSTVPVRAERFKLRQRALHVFAEALRVHEFVALMDSPSAPQTPKEQEALLGAMGDLMNATQDSCRDVYECSCPELDELCRIARAAGSYGSRLTGAGWGGCSVHLVPKAKVEEIRAAWVEQYYQKRFPEFDDARLEQAVVVTEPGQGAMIIREDLTMQSE